jgi:hypothetical protein
MFALSSSTIGVATILTCAFINKGSDDVLAYSLAAFGVALVAVFFLCKVCEFGTRVITSDKNNAKEKVIEAFQLTLNPCYKQEISSAYGKI